MKIFKQIHLYKILIQGISTIFIDLLSTCIFLKKKKGTFYAGIKIFNSLPPCLIILQKDKTEFKAAFRKYLNTHCFYSVDETFMCKDDLYYCFVKCLW